MRALGLGVAAVLVLGCAGGSGGLKTDSKLAPVVLFTVAELELPPGSLPPGWGLEVVWSWHDTTVPIVRAQTTPYQSVDPGACAGTVPPLCRDRAWGYLPARMPDLAQVHWIQGGASSRWSSPVPVGRTMQIVAVPEPGAAVMLFWGVLLLALLKRARSVSRL